MEIKLDHPLTTTPLVFLDQLNPKHPKSHKIEPNRLASPGGNSSPPGSSLEKPKKNQELVIFTRAAWWFNQYRQALHPPSP